MALVNTTPRLADLGPAILERYNLSGPRYTSYPTAPAWSNEISGVEFREHLVQSRPNQGEVPLSLYIHLPFCETHCTFCGCNVIITPRREQVSEPYLQDLMKEIELFSATAGADRPVAQHHWGGGTPTYLEPGQLVRLHEKVRSLFRMEPDLEQSIEIHVNWTRDEHLHALAGLGFNRLSLGVQDFNPETQKAIRRIQSYERTAEVIELARSLGFRGINCDLIYGLPFQTVDTFAGTIERILKLRPDRIALYNFAFLPRMLAHQRSIREDSLPSGPEKIRIFLNAHDRFVEAGYRYIGMDHFALPDDELAIACDRGTMQRNFMGFTTHADTDLVGMGVSAISFYGSMYAQNTKKLPGYRDAVNRGEFPTMKGLLLDDDDRLRAELITALMCRDRVDIGTLENNHGIVFSDYFADELQRLQPMVEDKLLQVTHGTIELSFLGRLFVRNIAMIFDAYLARQQSANPMFSRTL
jgi:oxygen-independent coproporphyrinogen-3 oxidase